MVINPNHIETNIGFSKDFNQFEFRKAIGEGNQFKAYQIANYFAQNQKDNPMVVVNAQVFSFFSALLQYHGLKDKNPKNVAALLKVNPFFLKDYDVYKPRLSQIVCRLLMTLMTRDFPS